MNVCIANTWIDFNAGQFVFYSNRMGYKSECRIKAILGSIMLKCAGAETTQSRFSWKTASLKKKVDSWHPDFSSSLKQGSKRCVNLGMYAFNREHSIDLQDINMLEYFGRNKICHYLFSKPTVKDNYSGQKWANQGRKSWGHFFKMSHKPHIRPQSKKVGTKWKIWILSF